MIVADDSEALLRQNVQELLTFTRRSQAELAEHLRLSQPHVSMLLKGKRRWQVEYLDALANFFCVTVPLLFVNGNGDGKHDRRKGYERRCGKDRRRYEQL